MSDKPTQGLDADAKDLLRRQLAGERCAPNLASLFQRLRFSPNEQEFIRHMRYISPGDRDENEMSVAHIAAELGYANAFVEFLTQLPESTLEIACRQLNSDGHSPTDIAIRNNDVNFVMNAISKRLPIDWKKAVESCFSDSNINREILCLILNYTAPTPENYLVWAYQHVYRRALNLAASSIGSKDLIEWIVDKWKKSHPRPDVDCYVVNEQQRHPVNAAIAARNHDGLEMLIELGLHLEDLGHPKHLDVAISYSNHEAISLLLSAGARKAHVHPLYSAFLARDWRAFEILVAEGHFSVDERNVTDEGGYLHVAVLEKLPEFARVLLSLGANPYRPAKNNLGRTPLGCIASRSLGTRERREFLHLFHDAGVCVTGPAYIAGKKECTMSTAELLLVHDDDAETLAHLNELGGDLHQLNFRRESLLYTAVRNDRFASFKMLIEKGVELTIRNTKGE